MAQARLALRTRAFPVFCFDPSREGVLGACLSLDGNPDPHELLAEEGLTPADWATTEARFSECFSPLADGDSQALPMVEWLQLAPGERQGVTPFVTLPGVAEESVRLAVSTRLAAEVGARLRLWETLQELAGVVTPFTSQVRAAAEVTVAEERAQELAGLQAQHAEQLAGLQQQFNEDAVLRIRRQLMALAGAGTPGPVPEGNDDT